MPHKALTHKDLSQHLGVSETTIKSYRRKFPGCIPVANQGKPIRFTSEALAVCKRVRDLFELGMSIPEVRARLSSEFPWVSAETCLVCPKDGEDEEHSPKAQVLEIRPTAPPTAPLAPAPGPGPVVSAANNIEQSQDLSTIVSSLAKSVINLSQQQSALLRRLDSVEATMEAALQNIAQSGGQAAHTVPVPVGFRPVSAPASEPAPPAHLADKLSGIERTLEQTMDLLGNYVEAVQGLVQPAPAASGQQPAPGPGQVAGQDVSEEYLRYLATLPLVHKNENNDLVHLGDRSRGVYTLNDLKAVFAQACQPPEHYTAYWHMEKGQSWFVLEQPESPQGRNILMLIRLLHTERGTELAQIVELVIDGAKLPPMTLYPAIQELLG